MKSKNICTGVLERSPQQQGNEVGRLFGRVLPWGVRAGGGGRQLLANNTGAVGQRAEHEEGRSEHEVATAQRAGRRSSEITSRGGTEVRAE